MRPPVRVSARIAALFALLLVTPAAHASDLGAEVTFGAKRAAQFPVAAGERAPRILYDSGPSDPIPGDWDTALISGMLPDPSVRFMALRSGEAAAWVEHHCD